MLYGEYSPNCKSWSSTNLLWIMARAFVSGTNVNKAVILYEVVHLLVVVLCP